MNAFTNFNLGQSVTTLLTPNSQAETSPSGDINQNVIVCFQCHSVTYWSTLVSNGNTVVTLSKDKGTSDVTFKSGLCVEFNALSGGDYMVTVSGTIEDNDTSYKMKGKCLGIFTSTD